MATAQRLQEALVEEVLNLWPSTLNNKIDTFGFYFLRKKNNYQRIDASEIPIFEIRNVLTPN